MRPTRVLYVENDPTLRGIVGTMLRSSPQLEVVATCADATEALAEVDAGILDVALLDLALGKQSLNGTELGLVLRERNPNVGIVIFTQHVVPDFVASLPEDIQWVLADAQTNGGLLASVPAKDVAKAYRALEKAGVDVALIGEVGEGRTGIEVVG